MNDRVNPGYNTRQNWGKLSRLEFPPLVLDPPRATQTGLDAPLKVLCVCVGPKFPAHYVTRLQSMVARHLSHSHQFFCITDRAEEFEALDVQTLPVMRPDLLGWYSKINLFHDYFEHGTRILYFDLDIVIQDSIDKFAECAEPFIMIREFNPTPESAHNSSVMSWVTPYTHECFQMPFNWTERSWGDQECIWKMMGNDRIWDWPQLWVQSYKYHGRSKRPGGSIVVFHGDPKPDAVKVDWVVDNWR